MGTRALEELVDDAARGRDDDSDLQERYRGALLGVAAGNALGLPVEGQSRAAIRRHHPGGITDIDPAERSRPWDDDLAQTVLVAEALVEADEFDGDKLAAKLLRWRRDNGRGIGILMGQVLDEVASGKSAAEASQLVWEQSGWSTAGNGAVMRCAPVALRWRRSGAELVRTARASALVTHYDARCEWSTVVFAVALAAGLTDVVIEPNDLADALEQAAGTDWAAAGVRLVVEAIRDLSTHGLEDLHLDDPMDMGYTLKAMQVGLWSLMQEAGFDSVLTAVVNQGGDTDTNGAIAGAAMGVRQGVQGIPRRWLEAIPRTEQLIALADRLNWLQRDGAGR